MHARSADMAAREKLQLLPDKDAEPGRYAADLAAVKGIQSASHQANIPGVWDAHQVSSIYFWIASKIVALRDVGTFTFILLPDRLFANTNALSSPFKHLI